MYNYVERRRPRLPPGPPLSSSSPLDSPHRTIRTVLEPKRLRAVLYQLAGRNKKPNRTGRTEPFNSGTGRTRTRKRTELNRTEPRRVRKSQAELRRTGTMVRTEPTNCQKSGTETDRTEPVLSWSQPHRATC